jgi:hypothetical protein
MANYLLLYKHTGGMGDTPEAQEASMTAWMNWFGSLGDAVVDGGTPFGATGSVAPDGSTSESNEAGLGGYSIISATSLSDAQDKAKGCPVLSDGGHILVFETIPMG